MDNPHSPNDGESKMKPANAFRKDVRARWPHVTVERIRTVSFADLARASAMFAQISGFKSPDEYRAIKESAREFGIIVN